MGSVKKLKRVQNKGHNVGQMPLISPFRRKEAVAVMVAVPLLWLLLMSFMHSAGRAKAEQPTVMGYAVVESFPHDPLAFTQGLEFEQLCANGQACTDTLWESTGLYGRSVVRQVELQSGKVLQEQHLERRQFGEGLTKIGSHVYSLTWRTGTIIKWEVKGGVLSKVGELKGPLRDGWGLTTDGKLLLATDSSATLFYIDPDTMQVVRTQLITDAGRPIRWLNELELIEGELWANVWMTECIARIDLQTGGVTHWMLLHGLKQGLRRSHPSLRTDVLNGIAYDRAKKRIFVTGKKWPVLFEIEPKMTHEPDNAALRHVPHTLEHARHRCIPK
ncbi:glutamine cyclotransferase family protein [Dunaliella salina]|uniref:Glutamine cyclotransferase family protein n=1 Tax=Dunaliella salina TaxID=3046 RepID=A0ABQ7GEA1_DUNSA|nr:glutamine cyclotransferase family protein [Dunaliella salina]|eukprot:KAF5832902.1 glutamine cyclotransferase family protein [Dunaliella salina]